MNRNALNQSVSQRYIESAEFYEILSEHEWSLKKPSISEFIRSSSISAADPIIDIGSGTGIGLELINEVLPDSENLVAIEPSAIMRVGLMTRLLANKKLCEKVSVFPGSFHEFSFPNKLSIILMMGVIGFFDEHTRKDIWKILAEKMDKKGLIFFDVMMIDRPQEVSERQLACKQVGSSFYEVWLKGAPMDDEMQHWTLIYLVTDGTKSVRKFELSYGWFAFGFEQIIRETKEFGFKLKQLTKTSLPTAVLYF